MSDCFVLYLLLTCMKKKTSGADKFTNNNIISLFILHHEMTNYADLLFNSFRHGIVCFSNIPLFPASLSHTILSRHILPVPITIETVD